MKINKIFSSNLVFLDTEFSSMDPYIGEILSIGLVKIDGNELYLELEHQGEVSGWVKENIVPTLTDVKFSRVAAVEKIKKFVGKRKPYIVSYYSPYDFVYLVKLFKLKNTKNLPFHWIPIDFMSILFGMNIDPNILNPKNNKTDFYRRLGIDISKYEIHNALDDAKLLREVYLKLID